MLFEKKYHLSICGLYIPIFTFHKKMISTSSPLSFLLVRSEIQALQPQLVEWRRRLHQRPELGFREYLTAEFITQKLQSWGIDHQIGL